MALLGFLSVHWCGFGGSSLAYLWSSLHAEIPDANQIGLAVIAALALNVLYLPFLLCAFDHSWAFEPHRATKRRNFLGVPVRMWTYEVIGATGSPAQLTLRLADGREVAVGPSGWGSETDEAAIPPELRCLILKHLAIADRSGSQSL